MSNGRNTVKIGDFEIGGNNFCMIAGPCSIESYDQLLETAIAVKAAGAKILRGGIFKMRTSPNSFQGLGADAFDIVKSVKKIVKMPFITEITDSRQIQELDEVADIFQVGSRNMYNYSLLQELGKTNKPVLLKRGFSATIKEWLFAAEYIKTSGNNNVILCERGIRSFDDVTRNTLDLASVAYIKQNTNFPVIVDPSHSTGLRELVQPMSLAAAASGADGLIIEVHPKPDEALSDGFQSLYINQFQEITQKLNTVLPVFGKEYSNRI